MSYQKNMMPQQINVRPSPGQPATPGNPHQTYLSIGDMPPMDTAQQTMLWQQNQYLVDSGINSGTTTQAPSISAKNGIESGDIASQPPILYNYDEFSMPPVYGQPQVNEITGMQCVPPPNLQPSVYPDSMNESVLPTKMMPDPTLPMEPMSNATQVLRNAVSNLINYQDDSDLAQVAIPELAQLLNGEDHVVVGQAATMVQQLSKKEATRLAIINSPQMIASLIHGINTTADTETMRCIAGTLHNLSHHIQGLQTIYKAGVIPALVKLLSSNVESILFYAITTLHNLLLIQEGSKIAVRAEGGLQKMVALLQNNNVKFLAITTDCLQLLAYGNQDSKLTILTSSGPSELVRIMQTYSYEKLLWTTSRVLKVLSVCPQNKMAIINAGGMSTLAMHLRSNSPRLVQNCLWTLRNLSDTATQADNLEHLLQILVQMLSANDTSVVTCVAGILSNLTCNNQTNKMFVCRSGGIETLISTLIQFGDKEEITEPAVCALRHLTSRHPEAESAQNAVRMYNGLPLLIKLLQPPSRWPLMKAVMGLIRNLALSPGNQAPLREHGAIPKVAQILVRAHQDTQRSSSQPVHVDGVKMEEVLEGAIGTLHIMSREAQNRAVICGLDFVLHILVQLLHYPNENIQRVATGVLTELASEAEGVAMIEKQGAAARLSELVRSHNETLATNATNVLYQLKREKPKEPHHFQQRMANSDKFRAGPMPAPPPLNMAGGSIWPQKQMASWNEWGSSAPNFNQPNINPGMIPMNHDFSDLDMGPSEMGYDGQYATKNMPGGSMMGWFD